MKISFLIQNVYGIGGTNRTVLNLAEALAERHEVEIVSVFRRQDRMMFEQPAGVRIRPLLDTRPGMPDREDPAHREPTRYVPAQEEYYGQYSALTDERIGAELAETDADVLVGTRPSLNLLVARFGRQSAVRLAQEHMTHEMIPESVRVAYREWYPRLDAAITLTRADAEAFQTATPIPGLRLLALPNSVPAPVGVAPSRRTGRIVVAAGRLDPIKRYDVLLHAWAKVAAVRPDWRLRIYGDGPEGRELRALVTRLGLHNQVMLMGRHSHLETEWVKGSVAVVTSAKESFGMTIVEAMRAGLPVVSTDCPVGPGEIITDGADGLLVPVGDDQAVADALLRLIEDEPLREKFGTQAFETARRYDPRRIAAAYEELIREAGAARGLRLRASVGRQARAAGAAASGVGVGVDRVRNLAGLVMPGRIARRLGIETTLFADCTVREDGALHLALPSAAVPLLPLAVACRPRGDRDGARLRRFPLSRAEHGVRAALVPPPGNPEGLAEERWDLFLEEPGGMLQRLKPGRLDNRVPAGGGGYGTDLPPGMAVPYETRDGNLAVLCWRRGSRAEVDEVEADADATLAVHGRLAGGIVWDRGPQLVLLRRQDGLELRTECAPVGGDGERFRAPVPVDAMVRRRLTRHDDWDVWLAPSGGSAQESVRVGGFSDDVLYKKPVLVYPELTVTDPYLDPQDGLPGESGIYEVEETPHAPVHVKAYYNADNELSVYVDEQG